MIEHKEADAKANLSAMRTEVEAVLAYPPNGALFGSSTYTSPWKPGLWTYNTFADSKTLVGKWLFKAFAEPPVLISSVAPPDAYESGYHYTAQLWLSAWKGGL